MYLGTYILPGGKATSRAIAPFEAEAVRRHPYIRAAFGENFEWEVRSSLPLPLSLTHYLSNTLSLFFSLALML